MKKAFVFLVVLLIAISFVYSEDSTYAIMKATKLETKAYISKGHKEGNCVVIIGGVHGDETAGIEAAKQLLDKKLLRGTMIVIPEANILACRNKNRTEYYMEDLNRVFPGKRYGNGTERLAYDIIKLIKAYKPAIVIDLHESKSKQDELGNIGESIVFSPDKNIEGLVLEICEDTGFTFNIGAPEGSLNNEIANNLNIPAITVETDMSQDIDKRIEQHKKIINMILQDFGLDD